MEKKVMGMPANVALGLSYLFWPLAVIILIVDKELDRETKVDIVASLVLNVANYVSAIICIGPIIITVYIIVMAVFRFMGKDTKAILATDLAEKIVK